MKKKKMNSTDQTFVLLLLQSNIVVQSTTCRDEENDQRIRCAEFARHNLLFDIYEQRQENHSTYTRGNLSSDLGRCGGRIRISE